MTRHFLNLADAGGDALAAILNDAMARKAARKGWPKGKPDADAPLAHHTLGMIFEKARTSAGLRLMSLAMSVSMRPGADTNEA